MPDTWKQRSTKTIASIIVAVIVIAGAGAGVCVSAGVIYFYWKWPKSANMINSLDVGHLRNLILISAGLITFAISIWRAWIADKRAKASDTQAKAEMIQANTQAQAVKIQAETSKSQAESTMRQIIIVERGQITERLTRAIEQLGKPGEDILFLRIGAIQALERIGNDSRDGLPAALRLLEGFARETSIAWHKSNQGDPNAKIPPDVAEAVAALARLNNKHLNFLHEHEISIDLSGSYLPKLRLLNSNLTRFILTGCDLSGAFLWKANLSNAHLWYADLSGAIFECADLSNAKFLDTNLRDANLKRANITGAPLLNSDISGANITQINLDLETMRIRALTTELLSEIKYDKDNPPKNCPEGVVLPPPRDG
ncbi:MAG: pentapeptide repeat-containing protein [Deltaproteobacteria bacterium]|nr:pentapeptide repeat-containing protein [Deltaproteobacteria bacterium]